MKKLLLAALVALGTVTIPTTEKANAQVNVNINIGSQPAWGPVGHDYVQYYYIPEYNIYYDVMSNRYIYLNQRRWMHTAMLPHHLRHIDLYRTHKVVINQHNPYRYNNRHMRDYGHYRGHRGQMALRDNRAYQQYRGGHNRPPAHRPAVQQPRNHHRGPDRFAHQPQRPSQHGSQQHRRNDRIAHNQRPAEHRQKPNRGQQHRQAPNRGQQQRHQGAARGGNGQHDRGPRR